jgi:valacyclovir hydrolase
MPNRIVHGCSIHYHCAGTGSPLLFVPGALGAGSMDFAPQIPFYSATYEVIAVDPRGYGQSRPPQRDYPIDFYQRDADDMLALMTALGHEEFVVFGWSDGANIATLMAIQAPDRVKRLVVWGGNSFLSPEEIAAFQAIRSLSAWSPREVKALEQVYGDSLAGLWEGYVDGLGRIYAAGGDIYRTKLDRVACPTFVLHGELDPLVPSFHPRIISEGIRDSQLHVFPEGKHRIHAKYAAEFNQRTEQFLRGH